MHRCPTLGSVHFFAGRAMNLTYKPDFDEAKKYWRAYWAGEILDRPCASIKTLRDENNRPRGPRGVNGLSDPQAVLEEFDRWASAVLWLGEAVPYFTVNFGPDQYAAWLGSDLHHSSVDEQTSWAVPIIKDYAAVDGMENPHGVWWDRMLDFLRQAAEFSEGKFLVGVPDLHSNMDALSALRGPQDLCIDLMDVPEKVDAAIKTIRRSYAPVFEKIEEAGNMAGRGYIGLLPFYCEERFTVLQCDFACMVRPEHFRRWILPALDEESAYLKHSVYHYDGPDALVHLKDALSIPGIDAIQWIPGDGNPPQIEWMDLLLEIQKAGKGLYIGASPEEVKIFHRTLRPERVMYDVWAASPQEAEDLITWLKKNT